MLHSQTLHLCICPADLLRVVFHRSGHVPGDDLRGVVKQGQGCRPLGVIPAAQALVANHRQGMGHNGHIGFNEPEDAFELGTHMVDLTESTIQANKRFFASEADVPRQALTMGIKNIMQARHILVVVSGEDKADIVLKAFRGPVTPMVPASILQLHPNVTLVGDKAALSKLAAAGESICG